MKKGFSLAEIIISVGILAIISGYILKLYLTGARLNNKASIMDRGVNLTQSFITLAENEADILSPKTDLLAFAEVKGDRDDLQLLIYFDKNHQPTEEKTDCFFSADLEREKTFYDKSLYKVETSYNENKEKFSTETKIILEND